MTDYQILDLSDFDAFIQALEETPDVAMPIAKEAMERTVQVVVGIVSVYPAATAANAPGRMTIVKRHGVPREVPMGYYDRGIGWWYPVKNIIGPFGSPGGRAIGKSYGNILAKKAQQTQGVAAYRLSKKRSERLSTRWATQVSEVSGGVEGAIGNGASYKDYVNGRLQPALFQMRGWKTTDQAISEAEPDIKAAWEEAQDKVVNYLATGAK